MLKSNHKNEENSSFCRRWHKSHIYAVDHRRKSHITYPTTYRNIGYMANVEKNVKEVHAPYAS